ncbi:MAG TPA: PLDc N-terminal domain-containing protein [Verrucomicrobiae bacterium]|nr:PLDc N-terminal domain-containing protein [Verrucomicrobiae bacterium]
MIIDCAKNEPPGSDKIVWIIIVVVLNWVGAIVYFFARRKNRAKGQFFRPQSPPPSG